MVGPATRSLSIGTGVPITRLTSSTRVGIAPIATAGRVFCNRLRAALRTMAINVSKTTRFLGRVRDLPELLAVGALMLGPVLGLGTLVS